MFSQSLEHAQEFLFGELEFFAFVGLLGGWGHGGGVFEGRLALEVVVKSHEVLEFVGIFEEVSFDDEAEKLDKHEVFGVDFADGIV